jgi:hypothetical protein
MPGVKALLKAAATDIEQTQKASVSPKHKSSKDDAKSVAPASTMSTAQAPPDEPKAKHPGGRPTNKEKGIQSRKQYTLTLKADLYTQILENARSEDLSFSKYMERAVLEYMENHS